MAHPEPKALRRWPLIRRTHLRGFSLIELMITVVIIGILATAALPLAQLSVKRAKEQELRLALRQIRTALDDYKRAADEGRVEKKADASGYPPALNLLVDGVPDARKTDEQAMIYFLRRMPRDPFHADASVPAADTWGTRSYASPPDDPQPGADVYDVYSLSDETGINGLSYRQW